MNIIKTLFEHGPLGFILMFSRKMQQLFAKVPFLLRLFAKSTKSIVAFQQTRDSRFDKKFGTDTSGIISIKDLTIESKNTENAVWYEPMSEKIFHQMLKSLSINFSDYTFIDLGSGKGRVLLMATNYGFKKIIGIEFASDLNQIAKQNIEIFKNKSKCNAFIDSICEDATEFKYPKEPLVIFFYSPFNGKVMEDVVSNISNSYSNCKRKMILIFYGRNPGNIELLKKTTFHFKELKIRPDWTVFIKYRAIFLFSSEQLDETF